jgi:hypothetical protein
MFTQTRVLVLPSLAVDRLTKSAQDQLRALTSAMVGQTTMVRRTAT